MTTVPKAAAKGLQRVAFVATVEVFCPSLPKFPLDCVLSYKFTGELAAFVIMTELVSKYLC